MSNQHRAGGTRLLNAVLVGLAHLVHAGVIDPVRRGARLRAGKEELARLDDRLLRDIGLTRSQAHAAAYGLLKLGRHSSEESVRPAPREPDDGRLKRRAIASSIGGATRAPLARRAAGG